MGPPRYADHRLTAASPTDPILVCPGCRIRTGAELEVRTLDPVSADLLSCACGRRYPIIDGVPIVMADPAAYLAREAQAVVERDLSPEVTAALVEGGPDDAPYARLIEHLSIYLDAHWGDRAEPRPHASVPDAAFGAAALVAKLAERATDRVPRAVELGCSVGRMVAELARGADHVVGLDLQFGAVRRARQLLDGGPLAYARRMVGRHYAPAITHARELAVASTRRLLVCGDALDPPLLPATYQRVVALNLLDSVVNPLQLLLVLDGLCAPGGEVILTSPYAWQSDVVPDHHRLGGADPATEVARILEHGQGLGSRYQIVDEAELPWTLRRDARSAVTYTVHYLRARKC